MLSEEQACEFEGNISFVYGDSFKWYNNSKHKSEGKNGMENVTYINDLNNLNKIYFNTKWSFLHQEVLP